MNNLAKALKYGRISKKLARIIIRKRMKGSIVIDPDLVKLAYAS